MLSYRIGYSRKCSFGDWWRPCVQLRRGLTSSRVRANTYWSKGDKRSKYGSTDTLQHLHTVYSCHKRLKYCELIFPLGFPCQSFFVASRSFPCNCLSLVTVLFISPYSPLARAYMYSAADQRCRSGQVTFCRPFGIL